MTSADAGSSMAEGRGPIRFVHTADWQLGMTRHFLEGEAQARFSEARIDVIRRIGVLASETGCSFVVVSGDVFETNHVERKIVVRALEAMATTSEVTFYLLPGNHDPLNAASVFRSKTFTDKCPSNVVVLDEFAIVDVAPDVQISAAPWTNKRPLEDLVQRAIPNDVPENSFLIVVGHGAIESVSPNPEDPALIELAPLETAIENERVHYVALGDRHSTTSVGGTNRVWYSGAPEPTSFREDDAGNVLVVTLEDEAITIEPHPIGTWRFVTHEFDLAESDDVGQVEAFLSGLDSKAVTVAKLIFVGQISLGDKARLDEILGDFSDLFASLDDWERRSELVVLPDDADFASLQLSGFAQAALEYLTERAEVGGEEASVAQDALGLLYRLGGGAG